MMTQNEKAIEELKYTIRGHNQPEDYIILPEKPKEKKYVTINGIRYQDITAEIIDCGA